MSSSSSFSPTTTTTSSSSSSPSKKLRTDNHNNNNDTTPLSVETRPQIAILDFGSQFSHLIARRVRELHVFCELYSCKVKLQQLLTRNIVGIILSGGPSSVYDQDAPHLDQDVWTWVENNKIPLLGICYGMQEMTWHYGGIVSPSKDREYGKSILIPDFSKQDNILFQGIPISTTTTTTSETLLVVNHHSSNNNNNKQQSIEDNNIVWMSHGDKITQVPKGFISIAKSDNSPYAAIMSSNNSNKMFGIQFHPEVTHTIYGSIILSNFCIQVCKAPTDWNMKEISASFIEEVRQMVGPHGHVLGAVSGGVDSSVAAVLLNKAIGKRFHAVMVDNGCLRLNEGIQVVDRLSQKEGIDLHLVDASNRFLTKLAGITDPEQKRKIIGNEFIAVFQEEAERIRSSLPVGESIEFLLQGTLYPDVIESISYKGPSATIKTHHNVGGLPEKMHLKLIEPLRELFKDEVRELGEALGLDHESVWRHPFPGPGLAIRILGEVTRERTDILRVADDILIQEIRKAGIYNNIGQAFVVLLPTVKSVGVMGDGRTYESVACIRCVTTTDFMTADWYVMDPNVLGRISSRIINSVKGINRVCYDVTSKPPGTIEWE
jgi:GMP synthase (glutamine-hydrolysing)